MAVATREADVAKGTGAAGRILIRLPNWLGDVLMARPLLHRLRGLDAERVAVGPAPLLDLLRAEDPSLELHAWPAGAPERAALAARLRAHAADRAILLPVSFSSAWQARRWGARRIAGYAAEGRRPLLHEPHRRPPRGDRHLAEEYLALAPGGDPGPGDRFDPRAVPALPVPAAALAAARARLAAAGVAEREFAILAPGAAYGPAKRWSPERFAAVAAACEARGLRVVLCGDARDRAVTAEVVARVPRAIDLAGATALGEAAALCALARGVLSNDSGLAHLAAAVGAPTVVIFGSTSSAWTAPLGPRVRILQHAPVCAPCFQRTCAIGYRCLAAIEAAEAGRALAEVAA